MFQKSIEQAAAGIGQVRRQRDRVDRAQEGEDRRRGHRRGCCRRRLPGWNSGRTSGPVLRLQAKCAPSAWPSTPAARGAPMRSGRSAKPTSQRFASVWTGSSRTGDADGESEKHTKPSANCWASKSASWPHARPDFALTAVAVQAGGLEEKIDRLQGGALPPASMVTCRIPGHRR